MYLRLLLAWGVRLLYIISTDNFVVPRPYYTYRIGIMMANTLKVQVENQQSREAADMHVRQHHVMQA